MDFDEVLSRTEDRIGMAPHQTYNNPATFDGNLRIYLTLACNLRCSYCVNEEMGQRPHMYHTVPPKKWIDIINQQQRHVVLTGGEPFLYKGLTELINGIDNNLKVRVYSNFCLDLKDRLAAITRKIHFYISWHPQQGADRKLFLNNLRLIRGNRSFTADIHAIDAVESHSRLREDLDYFASQGFFIDLDADQRTFEGAGNKNRSLAVCSKAIYLIAPDGTRFQCVSRMMRNDSPMENIFDLPLGPEESVSECPDFGNCAPCDGLGQTKIAVF